MVYVALQVLLCHIKRPSIVHIDKCINNSIWKAGARALYKDILVSNPSNNVTNPSNKNKKIAKLIKLHNNPYLFFSDTKKPLVRNVRYLFKSSNKLGQINTRILRGALAKILK